MRVVNEKFETITEYDLTAGKLIPTVAVKVDAEPIDNVTKFAWSDEDWEEVQMYVPNVGHPTAPKNIVAGEYITVDGVLYLATENIPNGEHIIVGQNAVETTVEEQLYKLTKGE